MEGFVSKFVDEEFENVKIFDFVMGFCVEDLEWVICYIEFLYVVVILVLVGGEVFVLFW